MSFLLQRQILIPLIVACALFMEQLDGSIIATALPAIAESLHTDPLHLNLAITSYLFSLAVFIPLSGWLADKYGARTVFRAAIIVFTVSSMFCGLAQNLPELILARLVQGLGGAMMVPVGRLVIVRSVARAELVGAMAWLTFPALIGPVLGPLVGGFIVTYSSWRWIFFINVPIGLLGIILATKFIEDIREPCTPSLDWRGFLWMAAALSGIVFGFETIGRDLLPANMVYGLLVTGAVCFVGYLYHARRTVAPIIDLNLFRVPTFRAAVAGGTLFRIGVGALPFLLPLMLQVGFGLNALDSGMLTFASAAGALLMKLTASRILRAFGFRGVLVTNSVIGGLFLAGCGWFSPETAHHWILLFLLIGGFFRSLQFTALNTLTFAEIPNETASAATTLSSMMQQLSFSIGVGVGALMLDLTMQLRHGEQLAAYDFMPAFLVVGIISVASLFYFLPLRKDAGIELSGHILSDNGK